MHINNLTKEIIRIATNKESPLEKWLDLEDENVAELYLFHFAYGWLFIQDNKIVEMKDESIQYYLSEVYVVLLQISPLEAGLFFELFSDRFKNLARELAEFRKTQTLLGTFPNYFYSRICKYPLLNNEIGNFQFQHEDWNEIELSGMFAHQINYLQDNLKQFINN